MGVVLTVMNMKGGVGKTVVAGHLGGMLARYKWGKRARHVLLIDFDPQFNLSQMFLPANTYFALEKKEKTSRAILQDDETVTDFFKLQVAGNHSPPAVATLAHQLYAPSSKQSSLQIVPSTLDLMYLALGQLPARTKVFEERFEKFIDECRKKYEVVIIDCHPSGSLLTKTSLSNSDHVVVPIVPTSPFAARGVALMKQFLRDLGAKAPIPHLLFNMWKQHSPIEQTIRTDPKHANNCVSAVLHRWKALADPAEGQGFVWTSAKPYSTQAFRNLSAVVMELVTRLNL